jgi:hypothetical protein
LLIRLRIEEQLRISLIAAACIALPLLGACGSQDSQPTVTEADLAKSLQASGLPDNPQLANCAAKVYMDEGISQDGLRKMTKPGSAAPSADGTMGGLSKEDTDKVRSASEKIATQCMPKPAQ